MKKLIQFGLALGLLVCAPGYGQQLTEEQAKQPIAFVGDEQITAGEYARELALRAQAIQATTGQAPNADARFRRALLTEMIHGRILSVAARNAGVTVSEEDVEKEFQERKARFESEEAYQSYLNGLKITEEALKENMRSRMRVTAYVDQEAGELTASEEEIEEVYTKLEAEGAMNREVKTRDVGVILINPEGDADEAWRAAEEEANAVHARLEAGEDFSAVAEEVSDERVTAERGGIIREMKIGSFYPELEEAMDALEVGAWSEPLRGVKGWYIVKVLEENEPGTIPLDKVREGLENEVIETKRKEVMARIIEDAQTLMRIELVPAAGAPEELGGTAPNSPADETPADETPAE